VTELFGKNYEVMIIEYNKPVLIIDSDTLLIITTELIEALHSDDELQGLVGHEIAHSIFNERGREIKERVKKSGDPSAIHALAVIELSCDAIVARTLLLLGRDPRAFVRLIESLERNYAKDGESYHPAAEVRRKFVEGITPSTPVKAQQSAAFKALKSSLFLTRNH
jgi:predicted Zn-dependent protease